MSGLTPAMAQVGDIVQHGTHGVGVITGIEGADPIVCVAFQSAGTRRESIIAAADGRTGDSKSASEVGALIGDCAGYLHPGDLEEYPELDPAGYRSRGADVSGLSDEPGAS